MKTLPAVNLQQRESIALRSGKPKGTEGGVKATGNEVSEQGWRETLAEALDRFQRNSLQGTKT